MSIINIDLARKLRDFLLNHASDIENKFNMKCWREREDADPDAEIDPSAYNPQLLHTCKTPGCAVGWAPWAFGWTYEDMVKMKLVDKELTETSSDQLIYEIEYHNIADMIALDEKAFIFAFATSWSEVDNTPEGAAFRLDKLIRVENGTLDSYDHTAPLRNGFDEDKYLTERNAWVKANEAGAK